MDLKKFFSTCPTWQLRITIGLLSLVVVALAILATHGSQTTFPLVGEVAGIPSFFMFLGAYIITTSPAWREALSGGFSMMMPIPNSAQVRAAIEAANPKPRTRTQQRRDARRSKKGKKKKK